ncbi:tripartite tricarboxylate transporter TctB family protein [Halomonas cupida]|uniref:Tripartite tricarboxylate transporter TctB family protein n=1 Tax=Halomonas cupida TaxID=44933 RepID=A0A1M6ZES9_9GAMM|nr:tripartite tricarboxylate transporter TctB family protein [Halomonas cupida]SHL28879.1 Tripartite tricarboxylate transporter TctB family protein [Halomonas cupida]
MSQYKINKLSEVAFPAILVATSLGYLIYSLLLGAPISEGLPSPLFFPTVLGVAALLLSTTLLYRAILSFKDSSLETSKKEAATKETTKRPALIVIATIAYISIFSHAGYIISSLLYIFAIISIFSNLRRPLITALGSIIITTMGLVVFEHIFRIRLPGILG